MNRRDFIKRSALASGAFLVPAFLKPFETLAGAGTWRNLVIIQLSGGNDGLNTIVPFGNDIYYQKRKNIAIPKKEVIALNSLQGLHPALSSLKPLYDQGWMGILNSVGYPNPDRSHFRSMDIWQTASDADQYLSTGWIGRYLDSTCEGCENPHTAIELDESLSLALKGKTKKGIALRDAKQLYNTTREPFFRNVVDAEKNNMLNDDNLGYLYKTMIETYSSAAYIYETSKTYTNKAAYPQSAFAKELRTISTFINSGLKTRIYYVSLSGFDTHVGQPNTQERLLNMYAEGISAFMNDLKATGKLDETLIMTFSEFGRRVEENASNGTDHGTAGSLFVFGSKLKQKGLLNGAPDLSDLEDGDLKFKVDFRSVYATLLGKWLDSDPGDLLYKKFPQLEFI
jgi:uncharacterized protein (DUF1501 family)